MNKIKFKVVDKIERKGYPTDRKAYHEAHAEADKAEKKAYPSGYEKMKKVDSSLPIGQLAGTHTPHGQIKISKHVPPSLRPEVAYHEFKEWIADQRLCAVCKRGKHEHK